MGSISAQNTLLSFHCVPHKKLYKMQMTKNKRNIMCSISTNPISLRSNATDHAGSDVIVVGAGVAGSALAHTLAKQGRRVHVIERSLKEPNKIVGEILQSGGYQKLLELGLEDCVRGIDAQMILGYMLIFDGKNVKLPYQPENYSARSFHYGRFVQKLRLQADSLPNVNLEQGTVTSLIEERGVIKGVRYKNEDGYETTAYAPLTVVCDGGFSSLRKFLSKPKIEQSSHMVTLTLENCEIPDRNYIRIVTHNQGITVYPLSSTELRCAIGFFGPKLPSISNGQMADYLKTVVLPRIPPEMSSAFISSVEKGEIRAMPISCMPAAPHYVPGALLLGDALNMRHAILAGGMTVALQDVALIHNIFTRDVDLQDIPTMMQYTQDFYNSRKSTASPLNLAADCAYKVFYAAPNEIKNELNTAVFTYYSRRRSAAGDFTKLVSGLSSKPSWRLMFNMFVGSAYVFGLLIFAIRSFKQARAAIRWVLDATVFVHLRVRDERRRQVSFTRNVFEQNKRN